MAVVHTKKIELPKTKYNEFMNTFLTTKSKIHIILIACLAIFAFFLYGTVQKYEISNTHSEKYIETEKLIRDFENEVLDVYEPDIMTSDMVQMAIIISKYSTAVNQFGNELNNINGEMTAKEQEIIDNQILGINARMKAISDRIT